MGSEPEFEGYKLRAKLQTGPIWDLYHAVQEPLGRQVFIKALTANVLPSSPFGATLEREARLLAELSHPCILQVYDFVRSGDRMWSVLQFVDGYTLHDLIEQHVSFTPAAALSIGIDLARALSHAHERGVVHRDLQPKNIWLTKQGSVKLAHFAVAVDERLPSLPELLEGNQSVDAPAYCSPEQILGEPADPRSDLFSLGSVLYELVSGRRPFVGDEARSTTQKIRHDAPLALSRLVDDLPAAFERAIHRCLEKLPNDRFSAAKELVQMLEDLVPSQAGKERRAAVVDVLHRAGLAPRAEVSVQDSPPIEHAARPQVSMWPALNGLLLALALIALGGGTIQYLAHKGGATSHGRHTSSRLELLPKNAGYLRVVATPWAKVSIDGQYVDTTPFAHPIPLAAGMHYVKLEHPAAPIERRSVTLGPGETILLDVKMDIPAAPAPAPATSQSARVHDDSP